MCNYQAYRQGAACRGYQGYGRWAHKLGRYFQQVPVNIREKEDHFELLLFAPALAKENIHLTVKDDVLTISYQAAETAKQDDRFTRREYHHESFSRSFVLNGKVTVEAISAAYTDGILKVILPKNPERNQPAKDIAVA